MDPELDPVSEVKLLLILGLLFTMEQTELPKSYSRSPISEYR